MGFNTTAVHHGNDFESFLHFHLQHFLKSLLWEYTSGLSNCPHVTMLPEHTPVSQDGFFCTNKSPADGGGSH